MTDIESRIGTSRECQDTDTTMYVCMYEFRTAGLHQLHNAAISSLLLLHVELTCSEYLAIYVTRSQQLTISKGRYVSQHLSVDAVAPESESIVLSLSHPGSRAHHTAMLHALVSIRSSYYSS